MELNAARASNRVHNYFSCCCVVVVFVLFYFVFWLSDLSDCLTIVRLSVRFSAARRVLRQNNLFHVPPICLPGKNEL